MNAQYLVSFATWPLLFWLPGLSLVEALNLRGERGVRAAVSLLLSPVVTMLWMWAGALAGIHLGGTWVLGLVVISMVCISARWLISRDHRDWRRLVPPVDVFVILLWALIVSMVIPQSGLAAGMQWNDSFHTLLTQQIVDQGRIPFTLPNFMPEYKLAYPPSFHFVAAAWHSLSRIPIRLLVPRTAGVFAALAAVGVYAIAHRLADRRSAIWAGLIAASFVSAGVAHEYMYGTGPMVASMTLFTLAIAGSLDTSQRRWMVISGLGSFAMVITYPFGALPGGIWCLALAIAALVSANWTALVNVGVAFGGIVLAAAALPLVGLVTAETAKSEGGGGGVLVLLVRAIRSVYVGPYHAEMIGWTVSGLCVLLALGVLWIISLEKQTFASLALSVFSTIALATYFVVYSHELNAIGFSPNMTVLYAFAPVTALAGSGASWVWSRLIEAPPSLRKRPTAFVVLLALVALLFVSASYLKATSLRNQAHASSYVKTEDLAALRWILLHSRPTDRVVDNGLSDAGFWVPALTSRGTLFSYTGWPSLPPWGEIKSYLKVSPSAPWERAQLQFVGGDITISGLGPISGEAPARYIVGSARTFREGTIGSDRETLRLPVDSYFIAIAYPPDTHPDSQVALSVNTPGGGSRVFKTTEPQMRRSYYATRDEAIRAQDGEKVPTLTLGGFDWQKLRKAGYRYVYLGSSMGDADHRILDPASLSTDPSLRMVHTVGNAAVLEIFPAK